MPKQVDHQERRTLVAQALWQVIAERGLESASLREVATAAGVSIGQLQHYFGSKESMLRFTLEQLAERIGGRIQRVLDAGGPTVLGVLRSVVAELVPATAERRVEQRVWAAFLAYAAVDPAIAAILRDQYGSSRGVFAEVLRHAQAAGEVRPDLDADVEAVTLLALVDGLSDPGRPGRRPDPRRDRVRPRRALPRPRWRGLSAGRRHLGFAGPSGIRLGPFVTGSMLRSRRSPSARQHVQFQLAHSYWGKRVFTWVRSSRSVASGWRRRSTASCSRKRASSDAAPASSLSIVRGPGAEPS